MSLFLTFFPKGQLPMSWPFGIFELVNYFGSGSVINSIVF
ncbi:hypothetical protein BLGI_4943 [Brevibacillus laterosporus GI-9]|nr:hypothetical protein BLGI_4943 [Brevibacillus laterosporus GI-9]